MADRSLLVDPPTGGISTTCNQRVNRSIGALCYHNLTQHHYDFALVVLVVDVRKVEGPRGEPTRADAAD
jgi:hypothetical protein